MHSRYVGVAALAVVALFLSGCASLGTYDRPTDEDVRAAASAIKPASRQEAMRELRGRFAGSGMPGNLFSMTAESNHSTNGASTFPAPHTKKIPTQKSFA